MLKQRSVLSFLLVVNILGTIYGFIWYGNQLKETLPIFWPFVPDSPMASLFFVFVLIAFLIKRNWGLIEGASDCYFNKIWYMGCCCKWGYDLCKGRLALSGIC